MTEDTEIPSRFGRILTGAVAVVALGAVVVTAVQSGPIPALRASAAAALIAYITWLAFWRPSVTVTSGEVIVRNVFRTIHVPWPAIERVDTKYALTLHTRLGKYVAWSAPAPGVIASRTAARDSYRGLPESTYSAHTVRAGDNPGTDSGLAALVVRRRWHELQDAGFLENARLESESARVDIHWTSLTILVLLTGATIVAAIF